MTGFEVPRTIYRLEWDDEAYADLVVRVRAVTVREALDGFADLYPFEDGLTPQERRDRIHHQQVEFIAHVVDWNICENGEPVPVTVEALQGMEGNFVASMIGAWRRNTTGVSRPLDGGSTSGDLSAVESIPMETLSESLAS